MREICFHLNDFNDFRMYLGIEALLRALHAGTRLTVHRVPSVFFFVKQMAWSPFSITPKALAKLSFKELYKSI